MPGALEPSRGPPRCAGAGNKSLKILHIFDHSIPLQDGYAMRSLAILERQRGFGWRTVHLTGPRQGNGPAERETVEGWEFHRTAAPAGPLARLPVLSQLGDMRGIG